MNKIIFTVCMAGFIFSSCDSSSDEEKYVFKDSTGLTNTSQAPATLNNTSTNTVLPVNQPAITPVLSNPQPVITQQPTQQVITPQPNQPVVTQQPDKPTAPGMNPPHGQPNHRCDIAVGAPLNSKPAANPTINQQPTQTVVTQPTVAPTLPGMNPPHGQPGHLCNIAVGAPLSSAPPVAKKDSGQ